MPPLNSDFETAVQLIENGGFVMGANWNYAHEICQRHEGSIEFDRLHAILHLVEGDEFNWNYWLKKSHFEFTSMNPIIELNRIKRIE